MSLRPSSPSSVAKLVEEIKSRGRASFSCGNYPEAESLYTKGIELRPDAVLHANRALARLNLGKLDLSIEDGDAAIDLDKSYVKGHWRKGQALLAKGELRMAIEAFEGGMEVDPTNKALARERDKAKAKLEQVRFGGGGGGHLQGKAKHSKAA